MLVYERKRNTLLVRLNGELDHSASMRVRAELDGLIAEGGIRRLVFDLRDLRFMDSSGIGLIIGRYKMMKRRGGSVAICGSNARIDRIFDMAGVYQLVERKAEGGQRDAVHQ